MRIWILVASLSVVAATSDEIGAELSAMGLSDAELSLLEDFELRQLKDFVKGRGSVSRASKDEEIDLVASPPSDPQMINLGAPMMINPSMIQMPPEATETPIRHKLKKSKKKTAEIRAESGGKTANTEDANHTDDLRAEDYEKLAKLLQTFVSRRKGPEETTTIPPPKTTSRRPSAVVATIPAIIDWPGGTGLPPWAILPKSTTTPKRGLSRITESEEETVGIGEGEATEVSATPSPPLAAVFALTTMRSPFAPPIRNFEAKENTPMPELLEADVERDPNEWETKIRQLSRELSSVLRKLQTNPQTLTKPKPESVKTAMAIDGNTSSDEDLGDIPIPAASAASSPGASVSVKVKKRPGGKAFVTILREGLARQTDINEYVFVASITLIRDSGKVILVDTGLATDINGRTDLLNKLSKLNIAPPQVDYVITTHGHPDHSGNTNDFPDAVHFQGNMLHRHSKFNFSDLFEKESHQLTPNVMLIKAPGHTPDDIAVMVSNTDKYGTIAVSGDVFIAEEDMEFPLMWKPMAWSERTQETSRRRLLCEADYIVPGHGKVFRVTDKMRSSVKCLP